MKQTALHIPLAVVGTGMAGMAASIFARNRGISTVQVGQVSEIGFSSGCLDLFSIIPGRQPAVFGNPFDGMDALVKKMPCHPYSKVTHAQIRRAFAQFTEFMGSAGIFFHGPEKDCRQAWNNQHIITPAGTLKPTCQVPAAMKAGAQAIAGNQRIGIIGIKGLKGFGALQMAKTLQSKGFQVTGNTVAFPGRETAGDLMCERLAWDLETPKVLQQFIQRVKPHVQQVDVLGLPAVLGIYRFEQLRRTMEHTLGRPVFEIPTLSPSVTGIRLKEAYLEKMTGLDLLHFPVTVSEIVQNKNAFVFSVTQGMESRKIMAKNLILATGRFMGKGLGVADEQIKEMLFDLPVVQPENRSGWLCHDFFDPAGHPVNRAGIETDDSFRPLGATGSVFHPRLYAAGSILAHQDWKREKSGAGISIVSAFKAVSHIAENTPAGPAA
ncbi:MAG TPA: glycerol-3-phosphate dehydrogenase subunit GlpB [Desulfotignum sp.]|nr:glycerol-3-phosphate dehydrogenase subunit GlpB [Desulfotignum sp.]